MIYVHRRLMEIAEEANDDNTACICIGGSAFICWAQASAAQIDQHRAV